MRERVCEQIPDVRSAGVARIVWPGMILAGLLLALVVWAAWPEPARRIVRLPDGESMPKTAPVAATPQAPAAAAPVVEEEEPVRVLAAVEPDPAPSAGPAPLPSELELSGDYDQESPEELGAEPLPGAVLTPEPPPLAG